MPEIHKPSPAVEELGREVKKDDSRQWEEGVTAMFQAIAAEYESVNQFISLGMCERWRRRLLKTLADFLPAGCPVLDVGCGPGSLSLLARREMPGVRFISGDITPGFLDIAANSGNAAEVLRLSATNLPFRDACCGGVTSSFVLRNLPDLDAFYRECHRVLVPGGVAVMLDLTRPKCPPVAWGHSLFMKIALPFGAWIYGSKIEAYRYLDRSIRNCLPPEEMLARMAAAGLQPVGFQSLCLGTVTIYTARKAL